MKQIIRISFAFLFFIAVAIPSRSQDIRNIKVLDNMSSEPIAFVVVKFANNTIIGNANGEFQIALRNNEIASSDSISISALGYQSFKKSLKSFLDQKTTSVSLSAQAIHLSEVVVNPISIRQLLLDAVNQSSEKLNDPAILTGYYREVVKRDGKISKYADGMVDYYIEKDKKNRLAIPTFINASRVKELKLQEDDEKYDGLDSRINMTVLPSFIRPNRASVLDSNEFDNYQYQLSEIKGKQAVYKISFKPSADAKVPLSEGTVYIDVATNLILGINYKFVATEKFRNIKSLSLLGITFSLTGREVVIRYHIDDKNYYPYYALVNVGMSFASKKLNQTNNFKSELVTTKFNCSVSAKPTGNSSRKSYLYKNGNQYASNFWESIKSNVNLAEEEAFLKTGE